jgi:hypothetical protein
MGQETMLLEAVSTEQTAPAAETTPTRSSLWLERLGLVFVIACAAGLRFWKIDQNGFGNPYYAAAVRSMLGNWVNFAFGSFDPVGFVTVDKPPVALWIQGASAWLFGYSGPSLLLPQAVMGVGSVTATYALVRRLAGAWLGLFAALIVAVTPISVAVDRDNLPRPRSLGDQSGHGDGTDPTASGLRRPRRRGVQHQNVGRICGFADVLLRLFPRSPSVVVEADLDAHPGHAGVGGGFALMVGRGRVDAEGSPAVHRRIEEQLGARIGDGIQRPRPRLRRFGQPRRATRLATRRRTTERSAADQQARSKG